MPIYSMEGNIGVGKTTFINMVKQLHKTREIIVLEEPVAEWLSIKNNENIDGWIDSLIFFEKIGRYR